MDPINTTIGCVIRLCLKVVYLSSLVLKSKLKVKTSYAILLNVASLYLPFQSQRKRVMLIRMTEQGSGGQYVMVMTYLNQILQQKHRNLLGVPQC